jgi:hypothetical protein
MAVGGKRCSDPMDEVKATISRFCVRVRYFSAIAPAATRPYDLSHTGSLLTLHGERIPIVSRALLLPPPLLALTPYFSMYVQSAWLGLGNRSIVFPP